jgi:hypothetical protein
MGDMVAQEDLPAVDVIIACYGEPVDIIEPVATAGECVLAAQLQ